MKSLLIVSAVALALSGCASSTQLSQGAMDTEAVILSDLCPILTDAKPYVGSFNGNVAKAYQTLSLACPPNPVPNNLIVALADLQAAYSILQPVVSGLLAKK